ncbi:DUF6409 family protein [Streptomyces sp. NPDC021354]|uniref:DUF6409 family protein n=1 Tax=Streptomyces sp. NPDC021354 TaxID=3154793 RepID=UPI0033C116FF
MTVTSSTAQDALAAGTVVRCWHYIHGENHGLRKAIVLGPFSEHDRNCYRVWFYTLGPASFDTNTVSHAFRNEIEHLGTVEDMSERTLAKVVRGIGEFPGSSLAKIRAATAGQRLRNLRLARKR